MKFAAQLLPRSRQRRMVCIVAVAATIYAVMYATQMPSKEFTPIAKPPAPARQSEMPLAPASALSIRAPSPMALPPAPPPAVIKTATSLRSKPAGTSGLKRDNAENQDVGNKQGGTHGSIVVEEVPRGATIYKDSDESQASQNHRIICHETTLLCRDCI